MIIKESPIAKGLPRETQSLCPECKKVITARVFEEGGKALIEKTCPEHGYFKDVYWSDAAMYLRAEKYSYDGIGLKNPQTHRAQGCPYDCGICDQHLSHTMLANLDLTNRCNLKCPICFANANQAGYVYELSYDQILDMLKLLRNNKPVPCAAVQFSGGEPTIHPHFLDALKAARDMGFAQVQIATNGITIANDPSFAQKMIDAGLNTVYLSFDGLDDEQYRATRGRPLLDIKKKVIEVAKTTTPKMSIVLVPTIVNTINDDQVGPIFSYAAENVDVIRSVNYQPVSFTGRISMEELEQQRFTIPDLADRLEKHTNGVISKKDFYPIPFVAPLSELMSVLTGEPKIAFTTNTHCGSATYVFVEQTKNKEPRIIPITQFVDVDGFIEGAVELTEKVKKAHFKKTNAALSARHLTRYIDEAKAPEGFEMSKLITALITNESGVLSKFSWKALLIGSMHFQDLYNFDIERVRRCGIHQVTPDNRLIPFCTYNSGPYYREQVEKEFSVPLDEWKKRHANEENLE